MPVPHTGRQHTSVKTQKNLQKTAHNNAMQLKKKKKSIIDTYTCFLKNTLEGKKEEKYI